MLDGRAVGGGFEIPVALPRFAALAEHELLADLGEVGDRVHFDAVFAALELDRLLHGGGIGAVNHGARWHAADDALAALAGFAAARAVFAVLGDEFGIEVILAEIVRRGIDDQHDIAAAAAVAAIRTAARHVFFPTPRNNAVAAVARLGEYADVIDKHGRRLAGAAPGVNGNGEMAWITLAAAVPPVFAFGIRIFCFTPPMQTRRAALA